MFAQRFVCWWIGAFGLAAGAFGQTYVGFIAQVVGSEYTFPYSINEAGVIAGSSAINGGSPLTGFVRDVAGTITLFHVPTAPDLLTEALSINAAGAITGYYLGLPVIFPNGFTDHGFVRDPEGNITTFDPPGSINTQAFSINAGGAITGYYNEANLVIHGFVREPNGTITSFDPPDSISTKAVSINAAGAITGYYQKADGSVHGFLRHPSGYITSFDPLGSIGTFPASINYSGAITGSYNGHGFVRDAAGKITSFDGVPISINDRGVILGNGFLRSPGGTITSFGTSFCQVPDARVSVVATGINDDGVVTGWCRRLGLVSFVIVGWVRFP